MSVGVLILVVGLGTGLSLYRVWELSWCFLILGVFGARAGLGLVSGFRAFCAGVGDVLVLAVGLGAWL